MRKGAVDHVRDGLEAAVRMPGGAFRFAWAVFDLAHLVHVNERIEVALIEPVERAAHGKALALDALRGGGNGEEGTLKRPDRTDVRNAGEGQNVLDRDRRHISSTNRVRLFGIPWIASVNVNSREDRRDDRGSGGIDLGAMVPDRRPGRNARSRLALALRPFLQPDGPSGATGAGMLVLVDRAGATDAPDSLRPAGQPDDVSPPRPAGADGGCRRRALQRPALPRRRRGLERS